MLIVYFWNGGLGSMEEWDQDSLFIVQLLRAF